MEFDYINKFSFENSVLQKEYQKHSQKDPTQKYIYFLFIAIVDDEIIKIIQLHEKDHTINRDY